MGFFSRKTKGVCPECHSVIEDVNDNFCTNCGWKISKIQAIKTKNDLERNKKENTNNISRKEAEEKAEELKKKIHSKRFVNIPIGGTETNRKINEKIEDKISQAIDDSITLEYGTDEEKAEANKRVQQRKLEIQEYERFEKRYEKARIMNDENSLVIYREIINESDGYTKIVSRCYDGLIRTNEYIRHYDDAIQISKENIELRKQNGLDISFALKDLERIERNALLHKCVENNNKGQDLEANGQIDDAIICYKENVRLNTDTPFPYDRLASLYHYKREFENERDILKTYINMLNEDSRVGDQYKMDFVKRLENVESYLDTGKWKYDCLPSDPKIFYYDIKEAKTLLNSDEREKGISMLEDIMEKGTYNNTVYNTLFQTYKKDKKFDDAIRVCNKAIEVLGFFSNDRKNRWNINLEKVTAQKERYLKKASKSK